MTCLCPSCSPPSEKDKRTTRYRVLIATEVVVPYYMSYWKIAHRAASLLGLRKARSAIMQVWEVISVKKVRAEGMK
jgi:hypothetical protein